MKDSQEILRASAGANKFSTPLAIFMAHNKGSSADDLLLYW